MESVRACALTVLLLHLTHLHASTHIKHCMQTELGFLSLCTFMHASQAQQQKNLYTYVKQMQIYPFAIKLKDMFEVDNGTDAG